MYDYSHRLQFEKTRIWLLDILQGIRSSAIAELTSDYNIHYHCMLEVRDNRHYVEIVDKIRCYNKFFGRKTFNTVSFLDSYKEYMKKDYHFTTIFITDPVVKDDFEIFKTIGPIDEYQPRLEDTAAERSNTAEEEGVPCCALATTMGEVPRVPNGPGPIRVCVVAAPRKPVIRGNRSKATRLKEISIKVK